MTASGVLPSASDADAAVAAPASRAVRWHAALPDATALLLLAALAWLITGTGGRQPHRLSAFAAVLAVALLVHRPWNRVPLSATLFCHGLGVAAFVVVVTAPTGWAGGDVAASYAVAGQLALLVLAWARDPGRREAVVVAIGLLGVLQLLQGWLAWWGGGDPTRPFVGTFYWHNQAGVLLAAGAVALLGTVLLSQRRPWLPVAWVGGPLAGAAVLFTTSRASTVAMALGAALVVAIAVLRQPIPALVRTAVFAGAAWLAASTLTGPPFFSERVSPVGGTVARAETQSVGTNGRHRLDFYESALDVVREWPLTGAGFHSFAAATNVTGEGALSSSVHNGWLQALADGGLLLGGLVCVLTLTVAVVTTLRLVRGRAGSDIGLLVGAPVLLVLAAHSAVDFDWTFPALLAVFAILAAALATPVTTFTAARASGHVGAALSLAVLALSAAAAWNGGLDLTASLGGTW